MVLTVNSTVRGCRLVWSVSRGLWNGKSAIRVLARLVAAVSLSSVILFSSEFVIVLLVAAVSEPNLDVRTVSSFRLARLAGLLSWSCEHGR